MQLLNTVFIILSPIIIIFGRPLHLARVELFEIGRFLLLRIDCDESKFSNF